MNGMVKSISLFRWEVIVKSAIAKSAIGGYKNNKNNENNKNNKKLKIYKRDHAI